MANSPGYRSCSFLRCCFFFFSVWLLPTLLWRWFIIWFDFVECPVLFCLLMLCQVRLAVLRIGLVGLLCVCGMMAVPFKESFLLRCRRSIWRCACCQQQYMLWKSSMDSNTQIDNVTIVGWRDTHEHDSLPCRLCDCFGCKTWTHAFDFSLLWPGKPNSIVEPANSTPSPPWVIYCRLVSSSSSLVHHQHRRYHNPRHCCQLHVGRVMFMRVLFVGLLPALCSPPNNHVGPPATVRHLYITSSWFTFRFFT